MAQNILKRLVDQLKAGGMSDAQANATAISKMRKAGNISKTSTSLTHKGKARTLMGAAGRAKDRAASHSKHKDTDFKYSYKTNRATLK